MYWQRRLRVALAVFLALLVSAVYLTIRSRRDAAVSPGIERVDPTAAIEAPKGAEIVWTDKGREVFTLAFERSLTYQDGRSVFSGVRIRIPGQEGEAMRVTSREAEITTPPNQPRRVVLKGDVHIASNAGLTVESREASYDERSKIVHLRGAVTFSKGRMSGSGRHAAYHQESETLELSGPVRVKVERGAEGDEALTVEAGAATLERGRHAMLFERGATIVSGERRLQGETITAFLDDAEERIQRLEVRGDARMTGAAASPGAVRLMQGDEMTLLYAPDGRTLERAELRGDAQVELEGTAAAPRRLRARAIDIAVGPDGEGLQQLTARDEVQLELPGESPTAGRRISSQTLRGSPAEGGREVRRFVFSGNVEYHERRAAETGGRPVDRIARSDRLDTTLSTGLGEPETAEFRGRVTIKDGATTAESGVARYQPARDLMTLETPAGVAGSAPRVVDDRVSISASWIEMTLGTSALVAKGDVRSLLRPARRGASAEAPGEEAAKLPVMLEDNEPVNVTSAALEYDASRSRATYAGDARLWQGETTIQAATIVLDEDSGNLSASGNVRTRMLLEDRSESGGGTADTVETLGSSNEFLYEDAERRATYTGRAHVRGPQGDVAARRIAMFLGGDGRTLERAEAYDEVIARLEGGQRAEGSRLTYYGADDRYVMSGAPVKILETLDDGCRETTGSALTFIRSTDTIAVVGTEGNRSRTTPGRCPERAATPPSGRGRRDAAPPIESGAERGNPVQRMARGDAR